MRAKRAGSSVAICGNRSVKPRSNGGGAPLAGHAFLEPAQLLATDFPLGLLRVAHGVDQDQRLGSVREIQRELRRDGTSGR